MSTSKDIVTFIKDNLKVPALLPIKCVYCKLFKTVRDSSLMIKLHNAQTQCKVTSNHCNLNPIELALACIKGLVRKQNVTSSISSSVHQILQVCVYDIDVSLVNSKTYHIIRGKKFATGFGV